MIIGFDAKRAFFNHSGLGNYSRNTIRQLSQFFPSNNYYLYTPRLKNSFHFIEQENISNKIPDNFTGKLFSSYWRSVLLSKQLVKDKVEIYHGLSNELPAGIHKSGVKSVVTIHDLIFLRYPELYKKIDRKIYTQKFKYSCHAADTIIAISQQTKNDIIDFFKIDESKIQVVYQGCDVKFSIPVNEANKSQIMQKYNLPKKFILYVGTIEKRKNLLNIVKAIHEGKIDIPLVAVGKKTKYFETVQSYIFQNNLSHKVQIFSGFPFEDLPGLYQMAELFVYPSSFEGFGIPIIEALYSGIPVITTKGGCFSEAGGTGSLYVNPDSIEELSSAIIRLLDDAQLRNNMKHQGIEYVQKFNDDVVAKNLMSVYSKLF